jgi:hypothetical protein
VSEVLRVKKARGRKVVAFVFLCLHLSMMLGFPRWRLPATTNQAARGWQNSDRAQFGAGGD